MPTARLDLNQDIQPLSEFRKHTAEFIDRIKQQKRAIVLTQHGKSAAVLVDVVKYQQMLDRLELYEEIELAEQQIASGEFLSHEEAKAQIVKNLSKWK